MMIIVVFAMVFLPTEVPMTFEIKVEIVPGEPGAPTETVAIQKTSSGVKLLVKRISLGGKLLSQAESPLTAADAVLFWNVVKRNKLQSWLPEARRGDVNDFGECWLGVHWRTASLRRNQVHETGWSQPLVNDTGVNGLMKLMSAMVKKHAQYVELEYFPRP